jgi:hypothetical protein
VTSARSCNNVGHLFWFTIFVQHEETKDDKFGTYCFSAKQAAWTSKSKDRLALNQDDVSKWSDMSIHGLLFELASAIKIQRSVTSARSCNNVGHLFWFTIFVQHETNDVILYIHSVHKHRRNTFQRQNYKMRLKQRSLNWINSMQVKKILFTNVFFSWISFHYPKK